MTSLRHRIGRMWHRQRAFRIAVAALGGRPLVRYSTAALLTKRVKELDDTNLAGRLWFLIVIEGVRNSDRDELDALADELLRRRV